MYICFLVSPLFLRIQTSWCLRAHLKAWTNWHIWGLPNTDIPRKDQTRWCTLCFCVTFHIADVCLWQHLFSCRFFHTFMLEWWFHSLKWAFDLILKCWPIFLLARNFSIPFKECSCIAYNFQTWLARLQSHS